MKKLFLLLFAVISIGLAASAQTRTVHGTVLDALTDEPLIGVSVVPEGSTNGTLTDLDGNFSITINQSVKNLVFSYVGYKTLTVPVKDEINISLEPAAETLETVVVTGYGSGKKLGSVVGSVAVVGEDALENVTTPSFIDALQGKVSGLSIMSNSGDPSSSQNSIRLRGVNSLNSSNTPLFILDGAPVTETVFNTLNPSDIESITVLKDAASVAIYGSRAANGVIVITSKRGKYAEKATVNVRAKYGWSQMTSDKTEMMNSEQYIRFRDLIGAPVPAEQRYAWEGLGINTDWRKEAFNGHAPTYSLEASVTGGSEATNYYLSLNHMDQEGLIAASQMRRETLRASITTRATNWLRIGFQANLGYTKFQQNSESNAIYNGNGIYESNPMTFARKAMPMDSPYYYTLDENGKPIWGAKAQYLHFSQQLTPDYITSFRSSWNNRATINASLFQELTPIEGLTIRAQQALDAYDLRQDSYTYAREPLYTPMGDIYGVDDANSAGIIEGSALQTFSRYYQFTYTNTAEYRFRLNGVHNITLLGGQESIILKSAYFGVSSSGQSDKRQPLLQQGLATSFQGTQSVSQLTMNSFFISGSYNYADRYFLDLNYRTDGSSRFAPDHRWAQFWSAGAMWDMKQEKFFKKYAWINKAKLRVSYGETGNSNFSSYYAYFGLVGSGSNYNNQTSIGVSQAPNEKLSWERVCGLDIGINVGLFNKIDLDVDFYNKDTKDMIVEVPYSMTTGISSNWGNMASMRNTGVDVQLAYTPIQTRDWLFELHGNFNYNHNEITKLFDGIDEVPLTNTSVIYKKGHTANELYMVRYAGVDPRDGQQMWYTREGNLTKVYNETRDAICIGKSQYAPWAGGFGTNVSWKGISLLADFNFAIGKYMVNNDLYFIQNANFAQDFNQTTKMLDVWTHPGQVTDIPAPGQTIYFDTRMLENASFMRLKTLSLQYSLPKAWIKKATLSDVTFHFTGRNLLTFTNFTGFDPEPEINVITFFYPNTRQYEFGINLSF